MSEIYSHDRELIGRMLKGDEEAFSIFVDEYYPRLYRFAFTRVDSDPEAAKDVVQSTFEKLIPMLSKYRGEASLFTWMCSFCRYQVAAHWRKVGRQAHEVELAENEPNVRAALESLAALDDGPEAEVERHEVARLVRTTLDYLPIRYSNVLEWKYMHALSVNEIAARMETSPKAVESLLTRARQAFRDGFATIAGGVT